MSKAFWSHFKHFGRLLRKKLVCSGSVSHSQQTWWKSSHPARCKTRHTGKFSSKPMFRHYWQVGCGQTAMFSPSVRGRGWGGRRKRYLTNTTYQLFKTLIPLRRPELIHSLQGQIIFPKSPTQQKFAWRTDILRNRSIGCPWTEDKELRSKDVERPTVVFVLFVPSTSKSS